MLLPRNLNRSSSFCKGPRTSKDWKSKDSKGLRTLRLCYSHLNFAVLSHCAATRPWRWMRRNHSVRGKKKKAVAKARLWPCTQMPSFLAVPSLRRQKASMTTTKYFPWRDRVGSHMKMGITFRYLVLQHMPTLTEYYYVCIFRAYFFLQNIWDNILSGNTGLSYILKI